MAVSNEVILDTGNQYIKCRLYIEEISIDQANNQSTVRAWIYYRRTNSYSGSTSGQCDYSGTMTQRADYSESKWFEIPGNNQNWIELDYFTTTVTHGSDGKGTCTFTYSGSGGYNGSWNASGSVTLTLSQLASPPTGLSVSNIQPHTNGFAATVSISGWGNGGSTAGRYRELQIWTYSSSGLVQPRRYQPAYGSTLSSTITVNNSSPGGDLNIQPNTRYVIGAYAANGGAYTDSIRFSARYTLAPTPSSITINSKTNESNNRTAVNLTVSLLADGGGLTKSVQYRYRVDGGSWSSWVEKWSVSSGSATTKSGDFYFDNGKTIDLEIRSQTSEGNAGSISTTFETLPIVPITFDVDAIDINPASVAITGDNHLFIYNQSILQFSIDNIRSEHYTYINSIKLTFNGILYNPTTTYTTNASGITTNDSPAIITYGTVDFTGTKTATIEIKDNNNNTFTKTINVHVIEFPEIDSVSYSLDYPYYLDTTMTVNSWYNVGNQAIIRLHLYWTGDNGQQYDYVISDLTNSETADPSIRWIKITPTIWTAQTPSQISQITQYTTFRAIIDLREITGDYLGDTPWNWLPDKSKSGTFDNFNFEWEIDTEFGQSIVSQTNLSTPSNYNIVSVEGQLIDGVLTQIVREENNDFIQFMNSQSLQRQKEIRRLILVKENE